MLTLEEYELAVERIRNGAANLKNEVCMFRKGNLSKEKQIKLQEECRKLRSENPSVLENNPELIAAIRDHLDRCKDLQS